MNQVSEDRLRRAWLGTEGALVATVALLAVQLLFNRVLQRHHHSIFDFELAGSSSAQQIVRDWGTEGVAAAQSQIVVDFFFIVAYVAAIWYAARLIALTLASASRALRGLSWLIGWTAVVAGLCDVFENICLLKILRHADSGWWDFWADAPRTTALIKFSLVVPAGVIAAIGVVVVIFSGAGGPSWVQAHAELLRWLKGADHEVVAEPGRPPDTSPKPKPDLTATAISCSGGGIRSASFCLGGLQALTKAGIYQKGRLHHRRVRRLIHRRFVRDGSRIFHGRRRQHGAHQGPPRVRAGVA